MCSIHCITRNLNHIICKRLMENANEIQVDVENEPMNKTYQDKGLYSLLSEVID